MREKRPLGTRKYIQHGRVALNLVMYIKQEIGNEQIVNRSLPDRYSNLLPLNRHEVLDLQPHVPGDLFYPVHKFLRVMTSRLGVYRGSPNR